MRWPWQKKEKPEKASKKEVQIFRKEDSKTLMQMHDNSIVMYALSPEEGDLILWPMESGKMGIFEITKMERPYDPGDQSFCYWVQIGYVEDGDLENYVEKKKSMFFR